MDELSRGPRQAVSHAATKAWERIGAAVYDPVVATAERRGMAECRRRLLASAKGAVVEIGAGTGLNVPYYPREITSLVLTEPTAAMAAHLRRRVRTARPDTKVIETPGDRLPAESGSVDTVVSTLVLCTVPDPEAVLAEIVRVLRPNGQFLFCEHVRSDVPASARWQDRLAGPWSVFAQGCRCNRRTLATIEETFGGVEVDRGVWQGMPAIVRPLVIGRAVPGSESGGVEGSTGGYEVRPRAVESGGEK
ncbi:class I SAM-dependent methyltransferase [Rhodococcus sp. ACT016]|uniref:class I SAM-dependent methyltransferase n=1 Tax=Rhodococcus sp. ACT016 TaxID=3134808 RepID=UPI003D2956B8